MNYPTNDYTTQLQTYRPPFDPDSHKAKQQRAIIAWVLTGIAVVVTGGLVVFFTGNTSTTSHVLKSPAVVKAVAKPAPVAKPLLPAEKIAKKLGGTNIVGSSKSEMQNLNTGDSAGIVADYATFQMNGAKYIVLLFTGPTTKSVAELGFAEAGLGDAAYSGPTWDVYTKAQWDKAKSAANA